MNAALDCGTIDEETLSRMLIMRDKKSRVRAVHPYSITRLSDGRWQTHYKKDESSERKVVRAPNEDRLYEKLYDLYANKLFLENITVNKLYEEWLEYKSCITESPNTIKRHKQHYNKYFKASNLFNKKLKDITPTELNSFCNQLVKQNNMTRQEWTNVKTILKGMFEYAEDKEYLDKNLMSRVKISVKFKQVDRKTGQTETFNTEEFSNLFKYLEDRFAMTHDTAMLAVKINSMIGLRVGELVALKWKDLIDDSHIHVCREELRDQERNEYSVVHHTKTRQDRYVVVIPQVLSELNRIKELNTPRSDEEFIFVRDGERLTSRQINYVLEKYAERKQTVKKSSHKLRKTYASMLQANGVPLDEIRKQLGHSDLHTTMAYIFNPLTEAETFEKIVEVFDRTQPHPS